MRIGFPRAVHYYDYFPFWAGFFRSLNLELVTSPLTNRSIMESGLKKASDETCLPIKILAGHIQALKGVDALFLPRMVSTEEQTYLCPKLLGLPESILAAVPQGLPVLTVNFNRRLGNRRLLAELERFGASLGKKRAEVRQAFGQGGEWQERFERSRLQGLSFTQSMAEFDPVLRSSRRKAEAGPQNQFPARVRGPKPSAGEVPGDRVDGELTDREGSGREVDDREVIGREGSGPDVMSREAAGRTPGCSPEEKKEPPLKIALIGHSYLTQETYANLNLLGRLQSQARVRLVEEVETSRIAQGLQGQRKDLFWSHARKILGAGSFFSRGDEVDGIIYLSCFGCGTDSITQDLLARVARKEHKPYMVLTLDEHSGEAGLVTRLEAFLDMTERRVRRESDISAHG
ncbi:CoA enzyme activase uncharacterised domain (DUF2229) [Acididesulfobacillus acetoxydans]|uniref:CoA enzyme activase uncharacterized domain (DUF2229) n=1 Tax=Acididesulfobacillus acetoxydans TaxID=1561005 RepID=A0A8S0W8T9_9FIRM|nr:acyl-CoA dehydratase activase-related protein [Acididesulfobacillus acetoxydans]CAA7602079.1 CoA enzyme activase uncharacterised domain (DUF2229) [Acididesulfobacillus acetoxydans]CEJ08078.1 CoA enzyme activase uncharacterised domain (DUF2229) [Acididesulfobacillus acetoxydans]